MNYKKRWKRHTFCTNEFLKAQRNYNNIILFYFAFIGIFLYSDFYILEDIVAVAGFRY